MLSACSDEGRAGEVMWEVAAEPGSKPGFFCWPGVTLLSLLRSPPAPSSLPLCLHKALALQGKTGRLGRLACSLFCPLVAVRTYGSSIRALDTTGPSSTQDTHVTTIIIPLPLTQGQTPTGSQEHTGPQTPTEPQELTGLGTYGVTDTHRTTATHRTLGHPQDGHLWG